MTRRRVLGSVLHNFLGTYTSRYSDRDGYWLFGFLIDDGPDGGWTVDIDLLEEPSPGDEACPWQLARRLAVQRFHQQLARARMPRDRVGAAALSMARAPGWTAGVVNGSTSPGSIVTFRTRAVTDLGRHYSAEAAVFVAPHDPGVEFRSLRVR